MIVPASFRELTFPFASAWVQLPSRVKAMELLLEFVRFSSLHNRLLACD